jgi:transcriptional regulator with XRE-family HTH domain
MPIFCQKPTNKLLRRTAMSQYFQSDLVHLLEESFGLTQKTIGEAFNINATDVTRVKKGERFFPKKEQDDKETIDKVAEKLYADIKMKFEDELCVMKLEHFLRSHQFMRSEIETLITGKFQVDLSRIIRYALTKKKSDIKTVKWESLADLVLSEPNRVIGDIWVVLDSLSVEDDLMDKFEEVFKENLENGVKYTYFFLDTPLHREEESRLRAFYSDYKDQIEVFFLSPYKGEANYFVVPHFGYSLYDPNSDDKNVRKGYIGYKFHDMHERGGFRLHDKMLLDIVGKLTKIKDKQTKERKHD